MGNKLGSGLGLSSSKEFDSNSKSESDSISELDSFNGDLPLSEEVHYNPQSLFLKSSPSPSPSSLIQSIPVVKYFRTYGFFNIDNSKRRASTAGRNGLRNAVNESLKKMDHPDIVSFVEVSSERWIVEFLEKNYMYHGWFVPSINGLIFIMWQRARFELQVVVRSGAARYAGVILFDKLTQQRVLHIAVHMPRKGGVWNQHLKHIVDTIRYLEKDVDTFVVAGDFNKQFQYVKEFFDFYKLPCRGATNHELQFRSSSLLGLSDLSDSTASPIMSSSNSLNSIITTTEAGNSFDHLLFGQTKQKEVEEIEKNVVMSYKIDRESGYFSHYPICVSLGIIA